MGDIPIFTLNVLVCLSLCTGPPGQTKIDTDQKFGTHTLLDLIKNGFFGGKTTQRTASLETLPCQVDFPHISSIALLAL